MTAQLYRIRKTLMIFALGAALLITLLLNTVRQTSGQLAVTPIKPLEIDQTAAAQRLAGAIRIKTITYDELTRTSATEFLRLHAYLAQKFPGVHRALKREIVNNYSLLYTWQGSDPSARPILFMAHQDVVPINPGTQQAWQSEPFAGTIRGGYVWGRGSWDDKGNLLAIMEAVELLAAKGIKPRQTVYFGFGHDEEAGTRNGEDGARMIAALLKSRGVKLDFVLNEGLLITQGVMKGLDSPVALIGIAEKGYMTLTLSAEATGGHSSMPPSRSAIGSLSAALSRLEQQQMPASIRDVSSEMFAAVAPEFSGINRVFLSNLWLFGPLVRMQLEKQPSARAMFRTTTALTVIRAGNKEQVLPVKAEAQVNFRLLPGDSQQSVIRHAKEAVADDSIRIEARGWEASRVSTTGSAAYRAINRTIREVFPGTIVAPGLMVGGTDSRFMEEIADHIYRFSPVRAEIVDLPRFHGINERISVSNFAEMIRFYHRLLANVSAGDYAE